MNPVTALIIGVIVGAFLGIGAMAMMNVQGFEDGYRQVVSDMKEENRK